MTEQLNPRELNPRGGFYASESKLAHAFERIERKQNLILKYLIGMPRPFDEDTTYELQVEIRKALEE